MRYRGASKTVRARTAADARKALGRWITTTNPERTSDTLAGICAAWLNATRQRKGLRTVEEQGRIIRLHIAPSRVGQMNVGAVRAHHLEDFYNRLATEPRTTRRGPSKSAPGILGPGTGSAPAKGMDRDREASHVVHERDRQSPGGNPLSGGTIKHVHDVINAAMRWAQRRGKIERSPATDVEELPALARRPVEAPDVDELRTLLERIENPPEGFERDPRLVMFVRLAIVTGARRGELCGLRWADLTAEGNLRLRRAVSEMQGGEVLIKETKTSLSRRVVALDEATVRALRLYAVWLAENGWSTGPTSYLFPAAGSTGGKPDRPSRYSGAWIRHTRALGLDIRLHDLRHLVASLLLDAGVPVSEVSAQLGHARRSTTMDIYGHLIGDRAQERAQIIAAMINPPPELPRS